MGKLKITCPKCKIDARASDKFCPLCGRRLGFGVRSENELRAALNKLKDTIFVVKDLGVKPYIMADVELSKRVVLWALGEYDDDPVLSIVKDLETNNKVRKKDDTTS